MGEVKVNIKWGKQMLNDVEVDLNEDVATFKCVIYSLTMVPVDKQKLMLGAMIKDDKPWSAYPKVKAGCTITLMGSAEGKELKDPTTQMRFVEDMSAKEKALALVAKTGYVIPAGLDNLGNTCYMNSVVQCMKRVNELKKHIQDYEIETQHVGMQSDPSVAFTQSANRLFKDLDEKGESFSPYEFVQTMRNVIPQFDEKDDKGHHKQQDADECYTAFMNNFKDGLKYRKRKDAFGDLEMDDGSPQKDVVDDLFGIQLQCTTKNVADEAEEAKVSHEKHLILRCYIDNNNKPIDSIQDGIALSLEGEQEYNNRIYKKTSKISQLPGYLCINFVRFYWKKESNVGGTKAGRAKILRQVNYPRVLDIYEHCSDELKKSLDEGRALENQARKEEDDAILEGKKKDAAESDAQMDGKKDEEKKEEKEEKKLVGAAQKEAKKREEQKAHDDKLYKPHGQGLNTGNYELIAVVTHKGRSADGGHYMGWVHQTGDIWMCFDDDIVTTCKTDDIMALKGGGDWHTAFLCFYRKLETAPKVEEVEPVAALEEMD